MVTTKWRSCNPVSSRSKSWTRHLQLLPLTPPPLRESKGVGAEGHHASGGESISLETNAACWKRPLALGPLAGQGPSRAYSVMCSSLWAPKTPRRATRCHREPLLLSHAPGLLSTPDKVRWDGGTLRATLHYPWKDMGSASQADPWGRPVSGPALQVTPVSYVVPYRRQRPTCYPPKLM